MTVHSTTLVGIAGSLRRDSYNAALLRAAAELTPRFCRLETAAIAGIPLYDGDRETSAGIPDAVSELKDRIAASDGLVLATPEYNGSIPGVLKNAIDWLTRPAQDIGRVFRGRPVALMGATPGRWGTRSAQTAWLPVLRALGTRPWFGDPLFVSQARTVFDGAGNIIDEDVRERLERFVNGFAEFVRAG